MMEKDKFEESAISDEKLTEVSGGYLGPCIVYTIQRGDTLSKIASRYGTAVDILVKLNNIENLDRVYAGHSLLIPAR